MIQVRRGLRLADQPLTRGRISGRVWRQHLEGNCAVQPRIAGAIDLAHPAGANQADNLVRADRCSRLEGH